MHPILRNILVVVGGFLVGAFINSNIIRLGGNIIAPPEGVDVNDIESIKANIGSYPPIQFVMPFLAHALGTLVGAFFVAKLAANSHFYLSLLIGVLFLLGGVAMVVLVGGPLWFQALDLGLAYIPMAWLGYYLGKPKV